MFNPSEAPAHLAQLLKERIIHGLAGVGRDRAAIRRVVGRIVEDLGRSAGAADWSGEYLEYLLHSLYEGCLSAIDDSVAREEYEWAAELFYRVRREQRNKIKSYADTRI